MAAGAPLPLPHRPAATPSVGDPRWGLPDASDAEREDDARRRGGDAGATADDVDGVGGDGAIAAARNRTVGGVRDDGVPADRAVGDAAGCGADRKSVV